MFQSIFCSIDSWIDQMLMLFGVTWRGKVWESSEEKPFVMSLQPGASFVFSFFCFSCPDAWTD